MPSKFNPDRPWDQVFKAACKDDWFWKRQFEEPALLIRAGIQTIDKFLDGDARIEQSHFTTMLPPMPAEKLEQAREKLSREPATANNFRDAQFKSEEKGGKKDKIDHIRLFCC